jgi:hypothetical protein
VALFFEENMTNEQAVALAKGQFEKVVENALKAAILTSPAAVLETPPWNLITNEIIDWVAKELSKNAEMAVFFAFINFNVNQEGHDFMEAVVANNVAQKTGTEDEKRISEEKLKDTFTKLIVLSR